MGSPASLPIDELEIDEIQAELTALESTLQQKIWEADPDAWARERGRVTPWSKQREVLRSVKHNRRTAVRSCHEAGKSFIAATAIAYWLDVHPVGDAFAVTSAPTGRQVRAILWREVGRAHARGALRGRVNQTEWFMNTLAGTEELVAFGQKPADMDPTAFQGIHASRVLVVFDEACGMPVDLWESSDSLIANDDSRRLDIGNPDDPTSHFALVCRPSSGWHVISISAFDTPAFTGEPVDRRVADSLVGRRWVEEKRRAWAPTWVWISRPGPYGPVSACVPPDAANVDAALAAANPLWFSKILGQFPIVAGDQCLIPIGWLDAARERYAAALAGGTLALHCAGRNELGVDVGGGGDSSTTAHRTGYLSRIISEDHEPDTMVTCGKVRRERAATGATVVKVDTIGIGRGVVDRGREAGEPFVGVNVGDAPTCTCRRVAFDTMQPKPAGELHYEQCNAARFANLRAQGWWEVRDLFEDGSMLLDPADDATYTELANVRYKRTSRNAIQIEAKTDAKKRGVRSPNRADALMLSFLDSEYKRPGRTAGLLW